MEFELTKEETNAIASLKRLAKRWPISLWLFSASGTLCIMRNKKDGDRAVLPDGAMDSDYEVDIVTGIENDGGDW